jgi:hypothetical protein
MLQHRVQQQYYREQLIRQGIWNPEDPRDPEVDEEASRIVLEWINSQLAPSVTLQIIEVRAFENIPGWYRCLMSWSDRDDPARNFQEPLPIQERPQDLDTRPKAICASALALRWFLRQHPECAA